MTSTRMDARVEALERNLEKSERVNSELRDQIALTGRKLDQFQSQCQAQLERLEQLMVTAIAERQGPQTSSTGTGEGGGGGESIGGNRSFISTKKVELPNFSGEDPLSWLAKAELYFSIQNTTDSMKIRWAMVCMEGPALHWSRWLQQRKPSISWEELKTELLQRFATQVSVNPYEALAAVRQWSSVSSYIDEFIARSSCVADLAEAQYVGIFLNGLREEIRIRIRSHEISDIYRTMNLAREIERELDALGAWGKGNDKDGPRFGLGDRPASEFGRSGSSSGGPRSGTFTALSTASECRTVASVASAVSKSTPRTPGIENSVSTTPAASKAGSSSSFPCSTQITKTARPSTYQEYADLRARGLCFKCKEPYSPTHQCPNRGLRTLILAEDEEFRPEHFDPGGTFKGEDLGEELSP